MNQPHFAALSAADSIAQELSSPTTIDETCSARHRPWPQSLADGAAGIALLHIERARSGHGDWNTARTWLAAAAAHEVTAAANAGLFYGAPALAFVTHAAAGNTGRYRRALAQLDEAVIAVTRTRLAAAHGRIDGGTLPVMKEFDLVRGLAGLGAYHLRRHPGHEITRDVLAYLVRLTEPLPIPGQLPPWWTDCSPNGEPDPAFPRGHGNFGLSHGISSVLALLALAAQRGPHVAGAVEAIGRICAWTDQWRHDGNDGPWWPGLITIDQVHDQHVESSLRPRPSWCYGVAGMARAQQLAGIALQDHGRKHAAENAMLAALRDPAQLSLIPGIGLCHGMAGLLQAACRMTEDLPGSGIRGELARLAAMLTARLADARTRTRPGPGLMDGTAGAALALHTFGSGTPPASGWDAVLMLA